ncbi:hypothetical protein EV197_2007 [Aquimarina brevivitae]|uniref:Uncharacterized protein n=1 Tax=Aquimarina brevivitae TaxID=323412 RepID=A0A4V2F5N4_9FLAO|nr:hypothetical protein EV197_2007 [Aquimarina brevivitae]
MKLSYALSTLPKDNAMPVFTILESMYKKGVSFYYF